MPVLRRIPRLVTCADPVGQAELGEMRDAAVAWRHGIVAWIGPDRALPAAFAGEPEFECDGGLVIPGLVDCHTHLAFGGWRADEFALRARGATYQEIAAAGGGIRSTMRRTREATETALAARARPFLEGMLRLGVTTVEAKSGYGLSLEDEQKLLRVYRTLDADGPVPIVPTLLAAHVVPPEFAADRRGYVDLVCGSILPAAAREGLARFCDVFVEEGAFTADEARRILRVAGTLGLRAKLHVDQLGDGDGARLAAEVGAISADHLEYTGEEGARALAAAGTVAVALPIATLYLRQPPMRARTFVDAGCAVAVATDFNPGSAPSWHLPLALTLACTMNGLTPAEALKGATRYAARAIGLEDSRGALEVGKRADLVVLDAESPDEWCYHFRPNAARGVFAGGSPVHGANLAATRA